MIRKHFRRYSLTDNEKAGGVGKLSCYLFIFQEAHINISDAQFLNVYKYMNLPKFPHSAMFVGVTACGKTEFLLQLLETVYENILNSS